jgi:hypothetical protein
MADGAGTRDDPWRLTTPSGGSNFEAWRDEASDPPALVVQVGKTELRYRLSCVTDLHAMLATHGQWMALGGADEQKPAADGTVEAWARSPDNPAGGWYGLKKGLAVASATTSRRCWSASAWPRWSISRATTACGRTEDGARPQPKSSTILPKCSPACMAARAAPASVHG